MKKALDESGNRDGRYVLIEADTGSGVIAVPLYKYRDYNIIVMEKFDYQSIWAGKSGIAK